MAVKPLESPHYKALAALYPLDMDAEMYAYSRELDRAMAEYDAAVIEMSPNTCTSTLSRWEEVYGLTGDGTIQERRQRLLTAYNADSGIAAHHYEAMANAIGYKVAILRPERLFRAGLSRLGDSLYDSDELYTWTVVSDKMPSELVPLIEAFEKYKIPFTEIRWVLRRLSAFELESGEFIVLEDGCILMLEEAAEDHLAFNIENGSNLILENDRILLLEEKE